MKLLTQSQREQLLANGRNRDRDHPPVAQFFNPCGMGTWLFSELNPEDGDPLFGLCDLGEPELGSASLSEIASVRLRFRLGIKRDLNFQPKHPLTVYADAILDRLVHNAYRINLKGEYMRKLNATKNPKPSSTNGL